MKKMNFTKLVCRMAVASLMTGTVAVAGAQTRNVTETRTEAQTQEAPAQKGKATLGFGVSAFIVGGDAFGGGAFEIGYMPNPKQLLLFELGGGFGPSRKIGSYGYTISYSDGTTKTHTDGVVKYKYDYMEFMLSYNWLLGKSDKVKFRIGPTIGVAGIDGSDHYSPTSYEGVKIEDLPEPKSVTKAAFTGGIIIGLRWNFSPRGALDLNYRLTANTGFNFPERDMTILGENVTIESKKFGAIGNRINLSFGWKLGKL